MIGTGIDARVQIQQLIENQLPEFLLSENPNASDFLKQYYISQEHRGGPTDLIDNLDQYLKLDNLTPEVIVGITSLTTGISTTAIINTVNVLSTKGFPEKHGLFKINDEIFTYTGLTTNTFTGVTRGFSGITTYRADNAPKELVFTTTTPALHDNSSSVVNLSAYFLKEFYKKIKFTFTPGLEDTNFVPELDVSNFIKESTSLYRSKGTEESFKILFGALYGVDPKIIDLENYLLKPSTAEFTRREVLVVQRISGDPNKLVGQTVKKSTDTRTQGSVSEVEIFSRSFGRTGISTYYKLNLFVGYNDESLIEGTFTIPGKTKVIGNVSTGSTVITVDSTVGFGTTGTIVSGDNTIDYTNKTINQFLDCEGITVPIKSTDNIRSSETIFGFENGDPSKRVEMRITGVVNDFIPILNTNKSSIGEQISVRNLGESIPNPSINRSSKEIFANSWIYNTSSTFEAEFATNTIILKSDIDQSSLKVGDKFEIILRSDYSVTATAIVKDVIDSKSFTYENIIYTDPLKKYPYIQSNIHDIRRVLKKANSISTPIKYGNNVLTSDVQNVYNELDRNFYVASNSLPSYDIDVDTFKSEIPDALGTETGGTRLRQFNNITQKYQILSFPEDVEFITGDEVVYTSGISTDPILGLESGNTYNVKVLENKNQIKLYKSLSFIVGDDFVEFAEPVGLAKTVTHSFELATQANKKIGPEKVLKKFPLLQDIKSGNSIKTTPGAVGMLKNGVEIVSYKSEDKIYFGPIETLDVLNTGFNYDVINPPTITLTDPPVGIGTGSKALIQPVVTGVVTSVIVDPQEFDLLNVRSVTISGGNGEGAVFQPFLTKRFREISFDARQSYLPGDGGVDIQHDQIQFLREHNLHNGQALVYDRNGNAELGIGTTGGGFGGSDADSGRTLKDGSIYYPQVVGLSSIRLYETFADFKSGINTVGFTTISTNGIHKFRMFQSQNTLNSVKVLNSGRGYSNRKLNINPVGVSTINNTITFENHGFKNGQKVIYSTTGSLITGLSTSIQYQIIEVDNNTFRLAEAGIGGTITSNYIRGNYKEITGIGTGLHTFQYPPITLNVEVEYLGISTGPTGINTIPVGILTVTPVVRGNIEQAYVYDGGTGYGSTVLNFERRPLVNIKTGKKAELKPIISNGKIISVQVQKGGQEYNAAPDLEVVGFGTAIGSKLRAVVENGEIVNVVVINTGIGYATTNTTIKVKAPGTGAIFEPQVRGLSISRFDRFGGEVLAESQNALDQIRYTVTGYTDTVRVAFGDTGAAHSPIIGYAYDGNPIYGSYGYTDADDANSPIGIITSSYKPNAVNITDRPVGFATGFFVNDYVFDNSGDLDISNGRYCKTPEFPNGTYAYFASIGVNPTNNILETTFPYFIGDVYRSNPIKENFAINQDNFKFNESNLIRNTFPYRLADIFSDNDFIVESNELVEQTAEVESTTKGSVTSFNVVSSGIGYTVGEGVLFDSTGTSGNGVNAEIGRVTGKPIIDINTVVDTYQDVVFVWDSPTQISGHISTSHTFNENDQVAISGVSTYVKNLTKSHKIGIETARTVLYQEIPANNTSGIVTDIFVSTIPKNISVGSSIGIGTEKFLVLKKFEDKSALRVKRGVSGTAHTVSELVELIPSFFSLSVNSDYFESKVNDKVFFNPVESVGVSTNVGVGTTVSFTVGVITTTVDVPSQSIFLPNHPFKNNQQVTLTKPGPGLALTVSNTSGGAQFNLPLLGNTQTLYVINKSKDFIGLATQSDLASTTDGVLFVYNASNDNEYLLESNFNQVTAKTQKITSTVAVSTSHSLLNGDSIEMVVEPNQTGVTTVKYNAENGKLLINPISFNNSSVRTNDLNLSKHNLKTGEKVFYDGNATGLSTGSYYVYRIDDDVIQLGETLYDVKKFPPTVVAITTNTGGSGQELSRINPQIEVVKNNNIKFDLSHSSLNEYNFKIFYDENFHNEFVSTGSTETFAVIGAGTTNIIINYQNTNPNQLYYSIEKSGFISTSDTDVENRSKILYVDSTYTGEYLISGVGATTFNLSLPEEPESLSYTTTNIGIGTFKYSTSSKNTTGGVDHVKLNFGGFGYVTLPTFVSMASTTGSGGQVLPLSNSINRIKSVNILDPGFEYSADKTLRPEASISPSITVRDSNRINAIDVISGGKNYLSPPILVIVDPETRDVVGSGAIEPQMTGSTITGVDILTSPNGLKPLEHLVFATNNTNGIAIQSVVGPSTTNITGIITCSLVTPVLGFSNSPPPFAVGDKIFVENIQKLSSEGSGFNSPDNDFNFFTVSKYTAQNASTGRAEVEFDLTEFTSNTGIAVTDQKGFASIVKFDSYPQFKVKQISSKFIPGEEVVVFINGVYTSQGLTVAESDGENLKVYGIYRLLVNDKIKGVLSGTIATINTLVRNTGRFEVNYSLDKNKGWNNNIGKLSEDYQVLPDNDYYQNLSYSIKSSIGFDDFINPVNRLVHTSGLKNFADTGITTSIGVGKTTNENISVVVRDLIDERRVDTIHNFDNVIDFDSITNKSRFLKFQNTKLADFINNKTNRTLKIDDISPLFSNSEVSTQGFTELAVPEDFARFVVQFKNPNSGETQLTELVVYRDTNDTFTLEKGSLFSGSEELVSSNGVENTIRFTPSDIFTDDFDIKVVKNSITSTIAGIETASVGFVNLVSSNRLVGVGSTSEIIANSSNNIESYFVTSEVKNTTTGEKSLVELYVTHDDTNSYVTQYYADSGITSAFSSNFIGTFTSALESGVLSLDYENTSANQVEVRSRIVGFGTTAIGIGTYHFNTSGQTPGTERSLKYESKFLNIINSNSGLSYGHGVGIDTSVITGVKSMIRVSLGNTSAIHQTLFMFDGENNHLLQYPFISIGTTTGIGTFVTSSTGGKSFIQFNPSPDFNGSNIEIQQYDELIYTESDSFNIAPDLLFGQASDSLSLTQYNGINGSRINRKSFDLRHNGTRIFEKVFNPADTLTLNPATGIFNIPNHFFRTGEKLIYTPKSTFTGIGSTAMQHQSGTDLPEEVFAIKITRDEFKLATSAANANAGIGVTFLSLGSGNAHELEMDLKNEKALMSIDGIIQSPLSFTPINTTLTSNGAHISTSRTTIQVAGIATITTNDVIKIDDEFMKVVSVGIGTTALGPISGTGSANLLEVERGFVGTSATAHADSAVVRRFVGSYNIKDGKVHFTNAPLGSSTTELNQLNLPFARSDFNGRVYLRNNYTTNAIFDDISDEFTGIGQTFAITKEGVGIGSTSLTVGSSLLLINGIFQKPTTFNNTGNNYSFVAVGTTESDIVFTGITSDNNATIIDPIDVNQNQLPRGGKIVSLGFTGGLGVAPLVGAIVHPVIGAAKSISDIKILPTTGVSIGISTANFNNTTGQLEVTTVKAHKFRKTNEQVKLVGLGFTYSGSFSVTDATYDQFTGVLQMTIGQHDLPIGYPIKIADSSLVFQCSKDNYGSEHNYPRPGTDPLAGGVSTPIIATTSQTITVNAGVANTTDTYKYVSGGTVTFGTEHGSKSGTFPTTLQDRPFSITGITSEKTFICDIGISTIKHIYVGQGTATPFYADLNFGSGYRGSVSIGVTDEIYNHRFVRAGVNSITANTGATFTATNAIYDSRTGDLLLTIPNHGLVAGTNTIGISTESLVLSCSRDNYKTDHGYPRTTDPAHNANLSIGSTSINTLTVNVGPGGGSGSGASVTATVGLGGTLAFTIGAGGTGYINPIVTIPQPSYDNLPITGISRLGVGATTDTGSGQLMTIDVGASQLTVGIGTTLSTARSFSIAREGHSFKIGDKFKPVGLVTARGVTSMTDVEFTVLDTFSDKFTAWNFGEFDFIDSIKDLQNGIRTRFPLRYNGELVSFEKDPTDGDSALIDLDALLLIFIDGVIQNPGEAYNFEGGGTTFTFTSAPSPNDEISIFFYRGTTGEDSSSVEVKETVKKGDLLQVSNIGITTAQKTRTIAGITTSDTLQTNVYSGLGIDENNFKPVNWTKQKVDKVINGEVVYKSRDSIEGLVYPSAKIIKDVLATDDEIYVDNAQFFNYEENESTINIVDQISGLIIPSVDPVAAGITAIIDANGTLSQLVINEGGSGYVGSSATISIAPPVGVGTTATATVSVSAGVITATTITNAGGGYSVSNPPVVLASFPRFSNEVVSSIDTIEGFSGIVTGITTTTVGVSTLGLKFFLNKPASNWGNLSVGDPIYIYDTTIGSGVTSLATSGLDANVVGIGTSFFDNIYHIQNITSSGTNAEIITNIHSNAGSSVSGISSLGSVEMGKFSWGKLSTVIRSSTPIAIGVTGLTVGLSTGSGISTFPTIQRRNYGFNDGGALKADLG